MPSDFDADVVVIGSGASGGMAAWNLTRKGVKVLLLEAGSRFERKDFWTHVKPWERRARLRRGERPPPFVLDTNEQPYSTVPERPFSLTRVWGVGGKTNIWGRLSLRYSDLNLTEPERDGWEIPWPLRYSDLAPYYDRVERLIGVCGGSEDLPWLPGSKYYQPPPAMRCGEQLIEKAARTAQRPGVPTRLAVRTRNSDGWARCHYCGACGEGCDTASFFNSADHLIPQASATGNLRLVQNAVVARVFVNEEGRASRVQYFDRHSGEERVVPAKRVIVGAGCVDSTRILLNSTSRHFPDGLGNSSDTLGRYLCEQVRVNVHGFAPQLYGAASRNDDGISGGHVYFPRNDDPAGQRDYLRGFGIELWDIGCQPNASWARHLPGFGKGFKRTIKERYPARIELHPFGEVLPRARNLITVDKDQLDRYGVPVAHIDFDIGDNERKLVEAMYDKVEEILHALNAEVLPYNRGDIDAFGSAIHEHGTCRMGNQRGRSMLNGFNQMHEVPNVFVVDGSAFPTASEKNPTLTIMALSWRATDRLAELIRTNDV